MDPTQCYLEMLSAMREGDVATARERALALRQWLALGGFCPPEYFRADVEAALAAVFRQSAETSDVEGGDQ